MNEQAIRRRIKELKTLRLSQIRGFQGGNPKIPNDADRAHLDASLDNHGYVIPMVVWEPSEGEYELLDGHSRADRLRQRNPDAEYEFIVLDVDSVAEGRRIILAIQRTVGFDAKGLDEFLRRAASDGVSAADLMVDGGFTDRELDRYARAGAEFLTSIAPQRSRRELAPRHRVRPPVRMTHDDWTLHLGDCIAGMRDVPYESADAMITDPPAGIAFMGRDWDGDRGGRESWVVWLAGAMREAWRILKPGAHSAVWALPRTQHWTMLALENAGYEIRDVVYQAFATGFPKALDVAKAAELDTMQGVHTALKPAVEPWIIVRKPFAGTVADVARLHGTGGLDVDAARIGNERRYNPPAGNTPDDVYNLGIGALHEGAGTVAVGRWPAHFVLAHLPECSDDKCADGCAVHELERQSPGASRFFFCPKPSRAEAEAGLDALPAHTGGEATDRTDGSAGLSSPRAGAGRLGGRKNIHPTRKSIAFMRWLIRLATPPRTMVPKPLVLDPFAGSGTTGLAALIEGCRFLGWEQEETYHRIASERMRTIIDDPREIDSEP